MRASYWPHQLAQELSEMFDGYESPLAHLEGEDLDEFIANRMHDAPFHAILGTLPSPAELDLDADIDDEDAEVA